MTWEVGDAQAVLGWAVIRRTAPDLWATQDDAERACHGDEVVCAVVPAAEYDRLRAASEALARVEAAYTSWTSGHISHGLALTRIGSALDYALAPRTGTDAGHETSGGR